MVAMERHLWVNLADTGQKERHFLLDVPVSPSKLSSTSAETVIEKFREAKAWSVASKKLKPRHSRPAPQNSWGNGPSPSESEDHRQAQRESVATQAPPSKTRNKAQKRHDAWEKEKEKRSE